MLIKDEPYVAYLLTRYEKKHRDILKYGVDMANGDRIVYRHHTSPEFNIGSCRIRLKITTRDWQLSIVQHMKWLCKLPGWHRREVSSATGTSACSTASTSPTTPVTAVAYEGPDLPRGCERLLRDPLPLA